MRRAADEPADRRSSHRSAGSAVTALLVLEDDPRAPGVARRFLRTQLAEWEVGGDLLDTAELCLSELVTNAVIHAGTSSVLTLSLDDGCSRSPCATAGRPAPSRWCGWSRTTTRCGSSAADCSWSTPSPIGGAPQLTTAARRRGSPSRPAEQVWAQAVWAQAAWSIVISSRIRDISRASRRDTCIWVTPISLPIWAWVQPRKNRISTILRSRGDSRASNGARTARASARSKPASVYPRRVADRLLAVVVGVEGGGGEAAVGAERLDHQIELQAQVGGDLGRPRRAAELLEELALAADDLGLRLLDRPRRAHRPPEVAEVAAHLAADGRDGVAQEVVAALGVEAPHRLDEPDVRHLLEVVVGDAAAAEAPGGVDRHLHVAGMICSSMPLPLGGTGLDEEGEETGGGVGA